MQNVTQCNECGSEQLAWHNGQKVKCGVVDGRLHLNDVGTEFCLGCEACGETLQVVSGDRVAEWMTGVLSQGAGAV